MHIIETINIILSRSKYRFLYLFLIIIICVSIIIPIINTFNHNIIILKNINYDITKASDYIEIFIILITTVILYIKSNKSELNRYKENYNFYKNKYSKLELISLKNKTIISSSIDYLKLKHIYFNNINLKDIEFILNDCNYSLPFLIEEKGREILIEKFNIQEKTDYNGLTLSLKSIDFYDNKLKFNFCKSYYFQYLLTNMIPEYEIIPNLTIRDLVESPSTKKLNSIDDSLAENHLGISSLISINIDNETFLIIPKRTNDTTVFKGQLSPSVSGAANIQTCKNDMDEVSINNFFKLELEEELKYFIESIFKKNEYIEFSTNFIKETKLIGISRELKRLGKPELFFYYSSSLSTSIDLVNQNRCYDVEFLDKSNVIVFTTNNKEKERRKKLKENNNIDLNENESYLLIRYDKIMNFMEEEKIKSKSKSSYQGYEIYNILNINNRKFKLSESLLINLSFINNL